MIVTIYFELATQNDFGPKNSAFGPKKATLGNLCSFPAKCKNVSFSIIPAGTRSIVMFFLVAWTVPPSSVDHDPK